MNMSASKKLKALEHNLMTYQKPGGLDSQAVLLTSLPQIIELVQAAEKFERSALHWTEDRHYHKSIRTALVTLKEALTRNERRYAQ